MQIDVCTLLNLASTCMLQVSKVKKKVCIFAKIQAGEMLHGNLIQIMFPVCSSVALPRVLHIVLQEDVWRRRPRNTVAIVSHFSFSVLIKGRRSNPFPLTSLHKRLIHSYKSTFSHKGFSFKVRTYVVFFFFFLSHLQPPPPLLCARSVQPLTAVAMAARVCSTEITRNYRNKCKLQRYVEYSEVPQIWWHF